MTPLDVFRSIYTDLVLYRGLKVYTLGLCEMIRNRTSHDVPCLAQCQEALQPHRPMRIDHNGYWWPQDASGLEARLRVVRAIIASLEAPTAAPDPLAGLSSEMLKHELARREQVEAAKVRQITGRWVRRGTERGLLISMPVTEILHPIFEKDFGNLHVPASVYVVRYCGLIAQWPIADCVWAEREGF